MKDISRMTAEQARDLLADEYNWNVEEMARDLSVSIKEVTGLLQVGGEKSKASDISYDVGFSPVTNVKIEIDDPENPTEEDIREIVHQAKMNILTDLDEIICIDNVDFLRIYHEDGTDRMRYLIGSDPNGDAAKDGSASLHEMKQGPLYAIVHTSDMYSPKVQLVSQKKLHDDLSVSLLDNDFIDVRTGKEANILFMEKKDVLTDTLGVFVIRVQ